MPDRKQLIAQQAEVVDKYQRAVLESKYDYDLDLSRCLMQAVDKYATLANPMSWPEEP